MYRLSIYTGRFSYGGEDRICLVIEYFKLVGGLDDFRSELSDDSSYLRGDLLILYIVVFAILKRITMKANCLSFLYGFFALSVLWFYGFLFGVFGAFHDGRY